jgi:hypothetical protein
MLVASRYVSFLEGMSVVCMVGPWSVEYISCPEVCHCIGEYVYQWRGGSSIVVKALSYKPEGSRVRDPMR